VAIDLSELRAQMSPRARLLSDKLLAVMHADRELHEVLSLQASKDPVDMQPNENASSIDKPQDACRKAKEGATYPHADMGAFMTMTISSRNFNQDTSRAMKVAQHGPVFIIDEKRPAHVLITFEEYQRLAGRPTTLADGIWQP
jgi:hypothetical protein